MVNNRIIAGIMDVLLKFLDRKDQNACEYREKIEEMLGDRDSYGYAEDTLLSILDYINEKDEITDGQMRAVDNIFNA